MVEQIIQPGSSYGGLAFNRDELRRIDLAARHGEAVTFGDFTVWPRTHAEPDRAERFDFALDVDGEDEPRTPRAGGASASRAAHAVRTVGPIVAGDALSLLGASAFGLLVAQAIHWTAPSVASAAGFTPWSLLLMLPLLFAYWRRGLYTGVGLHPVVELRQAAEVNSAACLSAGAALLATRADPAWAAFLAVACGASIVLVPWVRSLTRRMCGRWSWWGYPTVIISSEEVAAKTVRALRDQPQSGLRPIGIIDPTERRTGRLAGVPYLDGAAVRRGGRYVAPYAVVSLPEMSRDSLTGVLNAYRTRFPHLLLLSADRFTPTMWRDSRDCGRSLAGTTTSNRLMLPWPRFAKRATDVCVSGAALLLGLPVLLGVAIAVKLSSRGPLFFGHKRIGRDGQTFTTWKFRTMRINAAAVLEELLATDPQARAEWEADHKLKVDPRITPIGTFLRKTSLDELPQLWNVLRGDMSLVGPRPIVSGERAKYGQTYRLYCEVRPGISGLWQVSGRNNTTYTERVQFDDFYVRNWSMWLDAHILARTVRVLLQGDGAY